MIIEKTIEINTPAWAFWNALSSAKFSVERGGYYDCKWVANSQINWITNDGHGSFYGKLLQIREMQYLSFIKFDSCLHHKVVALISYQIRPSAGHVVIKLSADLIQNSGKNDEEIQAQWLTNHLTKLVALARKIQLKTRSGLYLA